MGAVGHLLFQRIKRLNVPVLAGEDAAIVAFHAVGVVQTLAVALSAGNEAA